MSATKGLVLIRLVIVIIPKAAMGRGDFYRFAMINSALPDLLSLIALIVDIKDEYKNVLGIGFKVTRTLFGRCVLRSEKADYKRSRKYQY